MTEQENLKIKRGADYAPSFWKNLTRFTCGQGAVFETNGLEYCAYCHHTGRESRHYDTMIKTIHILFRKNFNLTKRTCFGCGHNLINERSATNCNSCKLAYTREIYQAEYGTPIDVEDIKIYYKKRYSTEV